MAQFVVTAAGPFSVEALLGNMNAWRGQTHVSSTPSPEETVKNADSTGAYMPG